jgi:hypothetical protein
LTDPATGTTETPSARKRRVLIVAHTTTFLTELSLFGDLMRKRGAAETIFYCPFVHWTAEDFARKVEAEGVTCLLPPLKDSLARRGFAPPAGSAPIRNVQRGASRLVSRALSKAASKLPGVGLSFLAERVAFANLEDEIGHLLASLAPDILVLGGDMVGYDTSLYIKLAHAAGIPVMIVPSTMSNGLEQAEVYFADPNYHVTGWARRLVATFFPKWTKSHKGRELFRCPPGRILAMELAGLAPPQPWIFNSGSADAIAMESQAMIDYYAEAGMKHERMILTGSLSDDAMAERLARAHELRLELHRELDLDPALPLVLTALPPDFLYLAGGRPECDFKDYRALVDFWIDTLARTTGCNHVLALHPSVDHDEMRYVERDGIRISRRRTAELVPVCDIYVASISSTIRWAITCGKPVVNYDVYRYRYTDFLKSPGVIAVEEQADFKAVLQRLVTDLAYRASVAGSQSEQSRYWGLLDGRVGDRMLAEVDRLCQAAARATDGRGLVRNR